jgi:hyperosmotically inducible protein
MNRDSAERGFIRGALLLLVLIAVVLVLYYMGGPREVDRTGGKVAAEIERAAETVADQSEDAILTAKVKSALALSKSASAFEIDVDSDEGKVTLTGTLPSNEAKEAVLKIARDTDGVVEVVDRIQVDPSRGSK